MAIIDDDTHTREEAVFWLQQGGFNAKPLNGKYGQDIDRLVSDACDGVDYVFTDQRLSTHGFAQIQGIELAARLNKINKPTILVTQFTETDEAKFKPFRSQVPVILPRNKIDKADFRELFERVRLELTGQHSPDRQLYRSTFAVESVEGNPPMVVGFLPSWSQNSAVTFPLDLIPAALQTHVKPGGFLFVRVNLNAEKAADLYYEDFELAPEPQDHGF
ncbi:hypothetical protein ACCT30_25090 [Rhizobium ruizarguesonis]